MTDEVIPSGFVLCPNCGCKRASSQVKTEDFVYELEAVTLQSVQIVYTCEWCEASYPDMTGIQARRVAIEDHERMKRGVVL